MHDGTAKNGEQQIRLFFAVELSPQAREAVAAMQDHLRPCGRGVKWVEPKNLHFTLQFIGDVSSAAVAAFCREAQQVAAAHASFTLQPATIGAFPNLRRPQTLWVGAAEGAKELTGLAEDLCETLHRAGLAAPESRPFTPHCTIGRVKRGADTRELAAALSGQDFDGGSAPCTGFALIASTLKPSGPEYTRVASFALKPFC